MELQTVFSLNSMRREMARLLNQFEEKELPWRFKSERFSPPAEVGESHGEVHVNIQVPGASKEDLTLQLFEGALVIKGEIKEKIKEGGILRVRIPKTERSEKSAVTVPIE